MKDAPMPRKAWNVFRAEILALYEPPARAKNSWIKMRRVLNLVESLGVKDTTHFTPLLVNNFVRIDPTWRPATVRGLLAYLRPVFRYAQGMGYVKVDPFSVRKNWFTAAEFDEDENEAGQQHLSLDQVGAMLAQTESQSGVSWKGARLHALASLVAFTGLRRNEALTRQVKDFDLDTGILRIKVRKRRRLKTTAASAPVPMPDALVATLREWLPRTGSEWAFPGIRGQSPWMGGPMGAKPLDELRKAGQAAGIDRVTFAILRHTFATHAEFWGLSELMLQRILRHTTRKTQQHYRHADLKNMVEAVRSISFRRTTA